ncbi:aminotransferase class III-fold pyridoxal phosphate-dependent enzyme [Streptomyces sp. NPDC090994]|uniref:aminotransferase class III-fold pyridoxal phosphate-dependent enzyme n=1 Tax=Streptomyces sp. NPDC090994 TaxID=3365969 RepID=UPI0038128975
MRSVREAPSGAYEGAPRRQQGRETAARTYARALPIVPVRARGLTVEGADGRRYLDCLSGAGTLALGHNHPVVLEAIRAVLDSGAPLQAPDVATPVEDAFVDELLRTLPPGFAGHARVRFCGPCETDALATAVTLVRAATGRTGIVPCGADRPGCGGDESAHGDQRAAFRTDTTPAGMLLAPVSDESLLPVSDDRMRRVRRLTAARSVALIADERGTGVGRTGAYWAVDHAGVVPEVMVLSRAIGGSLPLSVVVHHEDLEPGDLGVPAGACCGNQLAMAAGRATLAHVRENRLAEHAATLGAGLLGRLRELTGVHPCVGEVRGRGLMIGIEFVHTEADPLDDRAGRPGRRPAPGLAAAVQRECLRRGLIVGVGGRPANVVRLLPPLTTTEEQAAAVLDRLADAVCSVARGHTGQTPPCPHPR